MKRPSPLQPPIESTPVAPRNGWVDPPSTGKRSGFSSFVQHGNSFSIRRNGARVHGAEADGRQGAQRAILQAIKVATRSLLTFRSPDKEPLAIWNPKAPKRAFEIDRGR